MKNEISRRSFLTGATVAGIAAAGAGLTGCSNQPQTVADPDVAAGFANYEWETPPEPITDIAEFVDTDILVVGAGLSGCACACAAAENGGRVTVVEKTSSWNGRGGGFGAIKSRYMDEQNIVVDKVNAKQHWIAQCASRANEKLISKFFNDSEEASNWLLDKAEKRGCFVMVGAFYSQDDVYAEQPGYHMVMVPEGGELTSTGFAGAELLYLDAVEAGAEFVFDSPAVQLVKDGNRVTGCICETAEGYVQYNASRGVVLCTGDIGGDLEMCKAYAPICVEYGQPRSQYTPVGVNTGDGHKMGMWVGAQLQDLPLPTMMHPQAFCWFHGPFLFVNDNGERFMCEDTWVQGKSLAINRQPNGEAWSVFDANWQTDLVNGLPYGGGMFWDSFRAYGSPLEEAPAYFETQIPLYIEQGIAYQADTIDELAEQIGCDASTLNATVDRYNSMCDAGEDTDFYKKPVFLTPVKEGPFYALKVGPALLTVTGGLRVNEQFECLDLDGYPIGGLYALGNVMGDVTAVDYPINVAGNSHGRCITFGYDLGRDLAGA
ncbi:Fumarate reductase flavoprotein subunit precursor [Slackia heliotrinireducens]|uniref:Succinate dehydrogenase/fumarate reductase flavoprotein subunit n=1 Tax=Slackia heliotrinireducens (strain ATCC 29202 / DSM 20476 / NCTC 11029 / RHS 1) TaxID=471855 RepID=C7N5V5_SLAHD|nr:FAD-dependent oxidoreductase [Slackia heliotrinireducens]ACV22290.1 succinate dehydrogenase/fumarate reductase flavoprotein subunit [Slackia heliotrinireducens DSM 20476]VEH00484.1 Fumarate reductase flavoprotein subunit precursor [Slackia heliotrinireducens]